MKGIITLSLCLLLSMTTTAQDYATENAAIAEAEMKSAIMPPNGMSGNTGNYDITYQKMEFEADPAVQFISGTITTHYTAIEEMTTITFDLHHDLIVSAVIMSANELEFEQNENHELVITLAETQPAGTTAIISVTYSGVPPLESEAFMTEEHEGVPVLWTLSQPYGSKDWWPCKHDLTDKADSIDVYITAPAEYISVSNGVEQSQQDNGDGTKTTHFKHNYPIPAYLVAIAISNYSIYTQEAGTVPNTFPVVNYIYPESLAVAQSQLEATPVIMAVFEELFEPYPFNAEKYGHAQCGFGGGMEHTTVSFMGHFSRNLIAHELAHQWFGDKVTCGSWSDLWLNEGFATYLSALVIEHLDGDDDFTAWRWNTTALITALPDGSVYVPPLDTFDEGRLFSSRLTYNKGAMVVHMLRYKLGDTAFYQGVKNYLADEMLAYSYAKTPQLQAHLEAASGTDLDEFFNDWVYGEGHPTYSVDASNVHPGVAKVIISQTQSHPSVDYFEMPCMITFVGAEGQLHTVTLNNTANGEEFLVEVPFEVTAIVFDPAHHIISGDDAATLRNTGFDKLAGIVAHPNPAQDQLNLTLPNGIILEKAIIYNTLGQKILESDNISYDISALAEGTYFIRLATSEGKKQIRFVKI